MIKLLSSSMSSEARSKNLSKEESKKPAKRVLASNDEQNQDLETTRKRKSSSTEEIGAGSCGRHLHQADCETVACSASTEDAEAPLPERFGYKRYGGGWGLIVPSAKFIVLLDPRILVDLDIVDYRPSLALSKMLKELDDGQGKSDAHRYVFWRDGIEKYLGSSKWNYLKEDWRKKKYLLTYKPILDDSDEADFDRKLYTNRHFIHELRKFVERSDHQTKFLVLLADKVWDDESIRDLHAKSYAARYGNQGLPTLSASLPDDMPTPADWLRVFSEMDELTEALIQQRG